MDCEGIASILQSHGADIQSQVKKQDGTFVPSLRRSVKGYKEYKD